MWHALATAHPYTLLTLGFCLGVIACTATAALVVRARRGF